MVLQLQESESKYKMKCIQIVKNHIQLLADNKLPEISRLENSTLEQITECVKNNKMSKSKTRSRVCR